MFTIFLDVNLGVGVNMLVVNNTSISVRANQRAFVRTGTF
jgi:hypothetical protein